QRSARWYAYRRGWPEPGRTERHGAPCWRTPSKRQSPQPLMMLSDLSVRRPVFATVAAIILAVIGVASFFALPVRGLANVDPPQVSITTNYTGASAEVIEERITQVIEQQVSGIQGIDRVTSSSRDGSSRISIAFTLDRNLDEAANDVRDAVSRVLTQLP